MRNNNYSLLEVVYQVIWLIIVVSAIITLCAWADSGARSTPDTTPSWITSPN